MDKFRKTFSVRKKKENESSESSKPQLWIEDERKIKEGSCSFQVKVTEFYLFTFSISGVLRFLNPGVCRFAKRPLKLFENPKYALILLI